MRGYAIAFWIVFVGLIAFNGAQLTKAQLVNPGGGGSGGAVTIADGADVAQGTTTDTACATDIGTCTDLALTKRTNQRLTTINTTLGTPLQAGGNVVVISSALPTGVSTSANQTTWQGATGSAPPANVVALGANASGATGGLLRGLIACDSSIVYDASTNGSTELIALTSGRTIYICGHTLFAGGTVGVKLTYGTGTACATGKTGVTPKYPLTAQVGLVENSPFWNGIKTASANALCLETDAGIAVQALIKYTIL